MIFDAQHPVCPIHGASSLVSYLHYYPRLTPTWFSFASSFIYWWSKLDICFLFSFDFSMSCGRPNERCEEHLGRLVGKLLSSLQTSLILIFSINAVVYCSSPMLLLVNVNHHNHQAKDDQQSRFEYKNWPKTELCGTLDFIPKEPDNSWSYLICEDSCVIPNMVDQKYHRAVFLPFLTTGESTPETNWWWEIITTLINLSWSSVFLTYEHIYS